MKKGLKKCFSFSRIPNLVRNIYKRKTSFIVVFHGVHKKHYNLNKHAQKSDFTIRQFIDVLEWLKQHFLFISPNEYFAGKKGGVLLTFDDGLANHKENVLPILEQYEAPAIFFVPTQHLENPSNWLNFIKKRALHQWEKIEDVPLNIAHDLYDGLNIHDLKQIAKHPLIEIGAHTVTHPDLIDCKKDEVEQEIKESKIYLEELIGQQVRFFAYPRGLYNDLVLIKTKKYYQAGFAVDDLQLGETYFEIPRISLHDSNDYYLNLKLSGLHKKPLTLYDE